MKRFIIYWGQRISFVLILTAFPLVPFAQTLAYHRTVQLTDSQRSTTVKLRDALLELQHQYHVDILFEEKMLEGLYVNGLAGAGSAGFEHKLRTLLTTSGLQFEKVKKNTYMVLLPRTPFKPSANEPVSNGRTERSPLSFATVNEPIELHIRSVDEQIHPDAEPASIQVTGRVTDEGGAFLPGVNVSEKGTTNGTATDAEGTFKLNVKGPGSVLVFSFVGYVKQEVAVGSQRSVSVKLAPDVSNLNEVVVIGYGSREKRDLTGSVSDIKSADISKTVQLSPELAMQGRMPGVFVSTGGGDPNARPTVRIRGVTTFGNNADPLYIIDGVPVAEFGQGTVYSVNSSAASDLRGTQNIFNLINPQDIESISVLKDASAAAIYGVRAANGVVLITTKRGKEGRPRVNFTASRGVQNLRKTLDVLTTPQFTALQQEAFKNNTALDPKNADNRAFLDFYDPTSPKYLGNNPTYDWQGALINKNAVIENYNLSLTGGGQANNYAVSAGYSHQESPLKFNSQERYSFGANTDFKVKKWLEVGETFRLAYTDVRDNRNNTGNTLDLGVGFASPWQPLYGSTRPDGLAPSFDPTTGTYPYGPFAAFNYLGIATYTNARTALYRTLGSAYATVIPLPGLRIKATLSADYYTNRKVQSLLSEVGYFKSDNANANGNTYADRYTTNFNLTKELSANYNRTFGLHSIDLLVNASDQQASFYGITGSVQQIPYNDPSLFTVSAGDPKTVSSESFKESWALQGYLGRVSYKFNDKYIIDATVLRNGSSRFAPDYRWGTFPSVSAAWRISNESFMKPFTFISDLKLRGGWGKLGNQDTRAFAFLSTVNRNPHYTLGSTTTGAGSPYTGAVLGDYANTQLTWEKVTTQNLGIDAAFLNNALTVTVEYYNRKTEGILQAVNFPLTAGINTQPVFNIANVNNRGIELALGYRGRVGDLQFNVAGNLTTVKNQVLSVYQNQPIGGGLAYTRIVPGQPINSLYGYQTDGIFQSQEEVKTWLASHSSPGNTSQLAPGDFRFKDLYSGPNQSGKPDGVVNDFDQTYLGKTIPGYYYGLNLGGTYKGFDLSILFQGVGDVQRVNTLRLSGEAMSSRGNNQLTTTLNRWTATNPSTTMPRAVYNDPSFNNRFSNRWVENAGFLRLNNLQVGYTLPKTLLTKVGGMDSFRVYVQSTNTFVITKYTGLDPENDQIPQPRSLILGLNASF